MKMNKYLIVSLLSLGLFGCGGGSDSDTSSGSSGDSKKPEINEPTYPELPDSDATDTINEITVGKAEPALNSKLCNVDAPFFKTDDFIVGYEKNENFSEYTDHYLKLAAKTLQAAMNELKESSSLIKSDFSGKSLIACYKYGSFGKFNYTNDELELVVEKYGDEEIADIKFILVMMFQSSYLGDANLDLNLPFWFSRTLADDYAYGDTYQDVDYIELGKVSAVIAENMGLIGKPTLFSVTDQESMDMAESFIQKLNYDEKVNTSKYYLTLLSFLNEYGLDNNTALGLVKTIGQNSTGNLDAFNQAIADLESDGGLSIPNYSYADMYTESGFNEAVLETWSKSNSIIADFIKPQAQYDFSMIKISKNDNSRTVIASIDKEQTGYAFTGEDLDAGDYTALIYGSEDKVFGPISFTYADTDDLVLDFSTVSECVENCKLD